LHRKNQSGLTAASGDEAMVLLKKVKDQLDDERRCDFDRGEFEGQFDFFAH